jgi:hypothetical protein
MSHVPGEAVLVVQGGYAYVGTYNDYVLRVLTLVDPNRPAQAGAHRTEGPMSTERGIA